MENSQKIKLSKFLSYILRHKPEKIGIKLQKDGWADVEELIKKSQKNIVFNMEDLKQVVAENDKQRFSFSEDLRGIRCNQGHTANVKIAFKKIIPPVVLYHGTSLDFMPSIKKTGLTKQKRHHTHLSKDKEVAKNVANRRKGEKVILEIDCKAMLKDGYNFFISDNGVYLVEEVPFKYIKVL